MPFVSRLTRPNLFKDPEVLDRLRRATWYMVPDSRSGPQRGATDLGELTIKPGEETKRPDGTDYDPITVRVVASRFPKTGKANHGRIMDGWQVELLAVDLPADAWPAPDVVASFFGRTGQENRFAQEDRELGLDRIISTYRQQYTAMSPFESAEKSLSHEQQLPLPFRIVAPSSATRYLPEFQGL